MLRPRHQLPPHDGSVSWPTEVIYPHLVKVPWVSIPVITGNDDFIAAIAVQIRDSRNGTVANERFLRKTRLHEAVPIKYPYCSDRAAAPQYRTRCGRENIRQAVAIDIADDWSRRIHGPRHHDRPT